MFPTRVERGEVISDSDEKDDEGEESFQKPDEGTSKVTPEKTQDERVTKEKDKTKDDKMVKTKRENTKRKKSECEEKTQDELSDSEEEERPWYEAEKLLATKMIGGKKYYRVKWAGNNIKPTWKLGSDVSDALKIQFHTNRTLSGKRRRRKKIC